MKKCVKKKKKKTNKIFLGLNIILSLVLLILISIINVLPFKYLIILYAAIILYNLIMAYFLLKKKSKISYIISIIFILISSIGIYFLNTTNSFLSYFNKDNYKTEKFLVLVLEDSYYNKIEDLSNKDIGYVKNEITSISKALDKVNKKIDIKNLEYENYNLVFNDILNKNLNSTLIEESNYTLILEENSEYNNKFRIIDTIEITTKIDNKDTHINVTKNTFNILISGIDTSSEISSVGRSDVNMIITINPKTKQVLMTSIPRDYYVTLYNTTGYKDKLTHSGLYGINCTVNTIEELLDIDINYYFRVNFSTLESVIDAIGGVDVYSEYNFVSYIGNYQFYKGYNHMNGEQALGFARERKSLPQGDISRAKNQQAVIDGIIRKLTNVSTITKYTSILNSLENTFQTNMTNNDITSLIKMQLNDNASWNITSNVLTGSNAYEYTYSYKGQKLYVMIPDNKSINDSINLINKVSDDILLESSFNKNTSNIKNPNKVYGNTNNNNSNSNSNSNDNIIKEEINNNIDNDKVSEKNTDDNINIEEDKKVENNTNINDDNIIKDEDKVIDNNIDESTSLDNSENTNNEEEDENIENRSE